MASTRARGRATELKVKHWYEAQGYQVQLAPMPTRWSLQNDLFGLWDGISIKENEIIFWQAKMNRGSTYGKKLDEHRAWLCPSFCKKVLILWEPRKREPEVTIL